MNLFDNEQLKEDIFCAYYDARKHKRNTYNALEFELHLEHNLLQLYREIVEYRYNISPSICFIVDKPVKREIFAANFRDRIVHHYVISKLMHIFENQFIYDSYSCRVGKGNLFGIRRLEHFVRSCSRNYTQQAYILKMDIQGFFMNINKNLLRDKVVRLVERKYAGEDKDIILYLLSLIILNDPTKNCRIKGKFSNWNGLPLSKSLFYTSSECGLPIGNLTSQIFANYYLNAFDHFMKEKLRLKYFGRYVDDFFVVHSDKEFLKGIVSIVRDYLKNTLGLTLHPNKVYLQSVYCGVGFVGGFARCFRTRMSKRTKRNFSELVKSVRHCDFLIQTFPEDRKQLEARINSYLGICQHFKEYRFCLRLLTSLPISFLMEYAKEKNLLSVLWQPLHYSTKFLTTKDYLFF